MSKLTTTLTFMVRKLWTLVAVLLVLFALLISGFRYSLPFLNDYKPQIQSYVAAQYGIQLNIGNITADWRASGPELVLSDVVLRQEQESSISLDVESIELVIDFWPTLYNRQLQSKDVSLNNLHIQIDVDDTTTETADLAIVNVLESVFLEQLRNFSITSSKISIHRDEYTQSVNLQQIEWLNKAQRHQARGFLALDNLANERIAFVMDIEGNMESYSGVFYALGQQLDVSPWLNKMTDFDTELKSSDANFELWATIEEGQFNDVRAKLLPTDLIWQGVDKQVSSEFTAGAQAKKVGDKWLFSINDLRIELEDKEYTTQWSGEWGAGQPFVLQAQQQFEVDYWFPLLGIIDQNLATWLEDSEISLSLDSPRIVYADKTFGLIVPDANFNLPQKSVSPGIEDLHFALTWLGEQGLISVKQDSLVLQSQQMFQRDMVINGLDIEIRLKAAEQGTIVMADDFSLSADDWGMSGSIAYNSAGNFLSVKMNTDTMPLNQVADFFPRKIMGPQTIDYLTRAFTGKGNIDSANVIWHGALDAFPFENNEGLFKINVNITDADFLFAPDWPELTELDIRLDFINKGLYMSSPSSRLAGVELTKLSAAIPHLGKNSVLTIDTAGAGTGKQLTELMLESSLNKSLGRVLAEEVLVSGDLNTNLSLVIPLANVKDLVATGNVEFIENRVNIAALDMDLTNAKGILNFENEQLSIKGLNAEFLAQPLTLDMQSKRDQTFDLNFDIAGQWNVEQSLNMFNIDLTEKLNGTFDYLLDLEVSLGQGDYSYNAELTSDLEDIQSNLPFPLSTVKGEAKPLRVTAEGDKVASIISLTMDDGISFNGTLPHKEKRFNRAHLSLGQTDMLPTAMGVGFSISANVDELEFDDWLATIKTVADSSAAKGQNQILDLPTRIFVNAEQVSLAGHRLTDVSAITRRNSDNWAIELNADEARASITINDQWYARGISVDADYIALESEEQSGVINQKTSLDIDPRKLPTIDFNCKDCKYNQYELGKIELEATPNSDGLSIEQLLINGNDANLNAQGQWYRRNQDHYTFMAGDFNSDDVGQFLQSFEVDSGIRDSSANVNFALTWQNSPFDFAGENLNGELNWELTDGYLSEVSDKGSRIFTLLSLNSLVRKLSLDFRDVFAKGFFYDEMKGSINITQGKADTRDTTIDGAAGEIEIYGFTDLSTKELNYNVSFTPNVTGNLPVLVYFFTVSPPSALAALALDQVLTSAKVISNVNYSVTGTIDEPILIETGRQSTDVELPARTLPEESELGTPFVAPTQDDIIDMQ